MPAKQTPIPIPRAEHLPLPLPATLRDQLSAHFIQTNTIRTLKTTLDKSLAETNWDQRVHERVLALLREGRVVTWQGMQDMLVAEALGKEVEEDDDGGEEGRERDGGMKNGQEEGAKEIGGGAMGIQMPEKVRQSGVKVVREALEKGPVVVREELTDGWEV